ncbi:acyl-CoA dehydrogenase family protein [Vulcanisaeta distributa]|uniref:Acyl-CoA dehydrogenase domain protein n=1 Tax=Vulcanisaeta distributa (strain DSM 14429 / JCM 11212 / NBRC 100878 / IC-017) TaxID=572478 RepID=E1QTU5_VULDI|nr:acyl-CoA dehydrogenase family protein [Vulcanisaeta distributa]ADN51012.1 acyl-CoA dehydrogenase domain protein [Vulcanisaeta distributa DSM 14429]
MIPIRHPSLTKDHEKFIELVDELSRRFIEPVADKIDRENYYPREVIRELGKNGVLAPILPREYGGYGMDVLGTALSIEIISRYSGSMGILTEVQGFLVTDAFYTYGNKQMKEELVPKLARGELIGSFALSEPCCGSDAAAIETRAERRGGEWVINGKKMWITQGLYADVYLVFTRTGPKEARHRAITAFLVRRNKCIEANPIHVMGIRGTGTSELTFNDCVVGDDDVVGKINEGFKIAMEALNQGRIAVASVTLGLAEAALMEALEWVRNRRAFDQPMTNLEWIQFQLADMMAYIETMRSIVYDAALHFDRKYEDYYAFASIAKLTSVLLGMDVIRRAVQLTGAYGVWSNSKLNRIYRDAKLMEIGEGTNEVQRMVIYKWLSKYLG